MHFQINESHSTATGSNGLENLTFNTKCLLLIRRLFSEAIEQLGHADWNVHFLRYILVATGTETSKPPIHGLF